VRSRLALSGVLVVVGLGALAAPAAADPWSPSELVTATGGGGRAAIGADGTVAVAYSHTTANFGGTFAQAVRVRESDGTWDDPVLFTPESDRGTGPPEIAVTAAGEVIVAYRIDGALHAAIRPPHGDFGPAQRIAPIGEVAFRLVTTPAGEATLAWGDGGGTRTARRHAGQAAFGPVEDGPLGDAPQLAVSADGTTALAWMAAQDRGYVVRVARRAQGGEWGEPETVSAWPYFTDPHYFLFEGHADGSLGILFLNHGGIVAATAPPGGRFHTTQPLDVGHRGNFNGGAGGIASGFAVGPGGRALMVTSITQWTGGNGSWTGNSAGAQLQLIDATGTVGAPVDVAGVSSALRPEAAFDLHGTAVATFDAGGWTAAVSVHQDRAPCPAERIGTGMSLEAAPMLDTGPTGVVAWGEPTTTNVHLVSYRARPGFCPPPLPSPQPAVTAPAPAPAAKRGRAPKVARIARVSRDRRSVKVRLTCTAASSAPCGGRLQLLSSPAARSSATPKRLGRARFVVRSGRTRAVRLKLTRKVRRGAGAQVRLDVAGRAPRARRVTLR
jgi:hypothetical protein